MLVIGVSFARGNRDRFSLANRAAGAAGKLTANVIGEVGQLIDNLPQMMQNFETSLKEIKDSRSWILQDLGN
jgi:hypothetical protein